MRENLSIKQLYSITNIITIFYENSKLYSRYYWYINK